MTVISLTTIPSRFDKIGPTLETLLAQDADISEIRLYIPDHYKRFPDYDGSVPSVPHGVTIHRCSEDLGPATKVLPAASELRGKGERILFCDDDRLFSRDWASRLIAAGEKHPDRVICVIGWQIGRWLGAGFGCDRAPLAKPRPGWADLRYRWKRVRQQLAARQLRPVCTKPPKRPFARSGWVDVFGGYGGVLIDPDWIEDWMFSIPADFWWVDDIWLSGCMARRGVGIWVEANMDLAPATVADRTDALFRSRFNGKDRNALNVSCLNHLRETHDIWG